MANKIEMTYTEIYELYYDRIFKYCLSRLESNIMSAEDITSEVFCELFLQWDEVKQRPREAILSWLYKTAFNMISEYRRSKARQIVSLDDENNQMLIDLLFAEQLDTIDDKNETFRYRQYIRLLREQLTETELVLFDSIVINHISHAQLAKELYISEKAVSMRWHRLKKRLTSFIQMLPEFNL